MKPTVLKGVFDLPSAWYLASEVDEKLEAIKTHLLEFPSLAIEILDKDEWMRSAEDWKNEHWKILEASG